MCYSAMVQQNAKKLGLRFQARIQYEMYADLFARRLSGERLLLNKALEYQFTHAADSAIEVKIRDDILKWHELQVPRLEEEIFKQQARLASAQLALAQKITKKAVNEKRIATSKISKIKVDLKSHRTIEIASEIEERIFPFHYMSMLALDEKGDKVIRPFRYLMRPRNKDKSFDVKFGGCYNARLDKLEAVPWWQAAFGKNHGILIVKKFFENVATEDYLKNFSLSEDQRQKGHIVICFDPGVDFMFIPTLWDVWSHEQPWLYSAALITDDPPEEIAKTGHNRVPIFLDENAIDDWLHPKGRSYGELYSILSRRMRPYYSHAVVDAA